MVTRISDAVAAYTSAANSVTGTLPPVTEERNAGPAFSDLVRGAAQEVVDTTRTAERMTIRASLGRADLTEVVMAVSAAEISMQGVVAVRDKVVQAYQEILRMPI
jgi:flagellar hook-basal body complex protein FliE